MEIAWGEEKLVPWIVRPFSFPMEYNLALFSSIHSSPPPPPPLRILISFSFRVIGSFAENLSSSFSTTMLLLTAQFQFYWNIYRKVYHYNFEFVILL